eukprot:6491474-Amphidinium_carterae.4
MTVTCWASELEAVVRVVKVLYLMLMSWYVLDDDVAAGPCVVKRPDPFNGSVSSHVKGEPEGVDSCGKMLEVDCNGAR